MEKASIVYNPAARNAPSRERLERGAAAMRSLGWEIDVRVTHEAGHATRLAREAAAGGAAVVFGCGGDGTINEVVNGLVGSEAALGVLRGGMGNVFAKEIGVAKAPEQALRSLFDGERRRFDLGVAYGRKREDGPRSASGGFALRQAQDERKNGQAEDARGDGHAQDEGIAERGRYFLLMAGVGFDAEVVKKVPSRPKWWLGSTAYFLWGAREMVRYRPVRTRIALDGVEREVELYWLLVGNTRSYGGVLDIARRAVVDDGRLDAYVFEGKGPARIASVAARLVLGRQGGARGVVYERVSEIEVLAGGLAVQVDGEFIGETPVRFGVAPGAIEVLLPRGEGRQLFSAAGS